MKQAAIPLSHAVGIATDWVWTGAYLARLGAVAGATTGQILPDAVAFTHQIHVDEFSCWTSTAI
jgi:hypothetical protein